MFAKIVLFLQPNELKSLRSAMRDDGFKSTHEYFHHDDEDYRVIKKGKMPFVRLISTKFLSDLQEHEVTLGISLTRLGKPEREEKNSNLSCPEEMEVFAPLQVMAALFRTIDSRFLPDGCIERCEGLKR